MVAYIIRRLIAAIILLFVVTFVTFAIFFGVPRLAGASADDLASRYVGKSASEEQIHIAAERLGFHDPIWEQYGRFAKGLVAGAEYDTGVNIEHCPAPCFGYSFITRNPVLPDLLDRLPVTMSLAAGAAILWLLGGMATGVISALRRGSFFDRAAMGVALAGVSLPIYFTGLLSLSIFSYTLHWTAPGGTDPTEAANPAEWAYALILPWITLAFLYAAGYARLTRAGHAGDHGGGLHPHRAGQGPAGAHGRDQTRAALGAHARSSRSSASTSACCSAARSSPSPSSPCPASGSTRCSRSPTRTCRRCSA